jgi:hypothetical protein
MVWMGPISATVVNIIGMFQNFSSLRRGKMLEGLLDELFQAFV